MKSRLTTPSNIQKQAYDARGVDLMRAWLSRQRWKMENSNKLNLPENLRILVTFSRYFRNNLALRLTLVDDERKKHIASRDEGVKLFFINIRQHEGEKDERRKTKKWRTFALGNQQKMRFRMSHASFYYILSYKRRHTQSSQSKWRAKEYHHSSETSETRKHLNFWRRLECTREMNSLVLENGQRT